MGVFCFYTNQKRIRKSFLLSNHIYIFNLSIFFLLFIICSSINNNNNNNNNNIFYRVNGSRTEDMIEVDEIKSDNDNNHNHNHNDDDDDDDDDDTLYNEDHTLNRNIFNRTMSTSGSSNTKDTIIDDDNTNNKEVSLGHLDMVLAGGIATAVGDFVMHPIDTIKTMQQIDIGGTTTTTSNGNKKNSLSMYGAARKIMRTNGISGLYSGVTPYVVMDGIAGAIKFAFYEASKKILVPYLGESKKEIAYYTCGAGAFMACSVVLVPGELLKQRLQAGNTDTLFDGIMDIWEYEGMSGFFTGYGATLMRDVPYTMAELGIYETLKNKISKHKSNNNNNNNNNNNDIGKLTSGEEMLAAAFTGGVTGYATNPLDIIKTRLMTDTVGEYKSAIDCFKKMWAREGMTSLFAGAPARTLWLMPFTAVYLSMYEKMKRFLFELRIKQKKINNETNMNNDDLGNSNTKKKKSLKERFPLSFEKWRPGFK